MGSCKIRTQTCLIRGRVDYLTATFGTIHKRFFFCFVLVFLSNLIEYKLWSQDSSVGVRNQAAAWTADWSCFDISGRSESASLSKTSR